MVMQEHLQNLMSQGSMTVAELAACHMPEDSAPPPPSFRLGGYVMACAAFNEQGFGVPTH
jgi:hypothetical protein